MTPLLTLCAAYGICFALQNKCDFLYEKNAFLDKMLACTFCTGFHAGWMAYLLSYIALWFTAPVSGSVYVVTTFLFSGLLYAFASAAFCYTVDSMVQFLERDKPEA